MKKVLMSFAALPFLVGVAAAGQPLTDQQLDRVTAGFFSEAQADAQGVVGQSQILLVTTATLAQVEPIATAFLGETSSTLFKSLAASQSSSATFGTPLLSATGP